MNWIQTENSQFKQISYELHHLGSHDLPNDMLS